jgi:hypothetical protein
MPDPTITISPGHFDGAAHIDRSAGDGADLESIGARLTQRLDEVIAKLNLVEQRLDGESGLKDYYAATAALGTMSFGAKADIAASGVDYFLLYAKKLHLDAEGTYTPPAGEYKVDCSGCTDDASVRDAVLARIDALHALEILPLHTAPNGDHGADLTATLIGALGNATLEEHCVNAAFTISGMTGGLDSLVATATGIVIVGG